MVLEKSSKMLILGQKMPNLLHLGHNKNFSQNMGTVTFFGYWNLTSCKKKDNSKEPILRKRGYRRTDR